MKIFYGWRIAAAGAGLSFLHSALFLQAFGAYVAVLSQERGWGKTALAGGAALQSVEGALLGPALGWLVDRFGPRILVRAGIVLWALGFAALSQIESIAGFYGAVLLMALGTTFSGYFPLSVTLVHWFQRWRTRALSLMSLGLAAGGIALPLVGWFMQTYGWRNTAIASAVLVLVFGWPLASTLRRTPGEMGEKIDGQTPVAGAPARKSTLPPAGRDFTALEAIRTRAFWFLGLGHGFALLVVTSVNVHALSHIKEGLGYSLAEAAVVITVMTMAQTVGILVGAAVGDQWNKRYVSSACMLAHMFGLLALTYANHLWMLAAFAILHGGAWGLRGPIMQAMRADYFGLQAIGMILGLSAILVAIGQVAGPLLAGYFADLTGNYRVGFTILAATAGSGSVLFMLAKRPA